MADSDDDLPTAETEYRKSRFTVLCHVGFLVVALVIAVAVRRAIGLPQQMLGVVIIVALLVFGRDIMRFMHLRSKVARLRAAAEKAS
jgi:hypothetical protein